MNNKITRIAKTFSDICREEGVYFHGILVNGNAECVVTYVGDDIELEQHVRMISELARSTNTLIDEVFLNEGEDENY